MGEYRQIELASTSKGPYRGREQRRLLQPEDTLSLHGIDRDWLRRRLLEPSDDPTVVVTHHGPALASVAERYAQDWLTPSFASALPAGFFEVPQLCMYPVA